MDLAYDHIAEKTYSGDRSQTPTPPNDGNDTSYSTTESAEKRQSLQTEFQDTFKAFSASPWGARLGGLWGNVRKQGETYYEGARKEAEAAGEEALKGFTDLKESLVSKTRSLSLGEEDSNTPAPAPATVTAAAPEQEKTTEAIAKEADAALAENETFLARFRAEATKRLKDIEKAEDAADEALLRFGTNVRNFLKEAIAVEPGVEERPRTAEKSTVIFDSKDQAAGRTSQERRKELLKASSTTPEEEVAWDDESESEDNHPSTPQTGDPNIPPPTPKAKKAIQPQHTANSETDTLRPEGRRSHDEKSVADSDASYDLVSGATSRAPGSPKDEKPKVIGKVEDSDEEDWE